MTKGKGIAIQTILMLLVGILVVGIVVYMVYRYMFSPGLTQEECRGYAINFCNSCKAAGCLVTAGVPADCTNIASSGFINTACDTFYTGRPGACDAARSWCSNFGIT